MALPLLTSTKVAATRSEEHTSELQSQSNLVCRLLLEKQNNALRLLIPHHAQLREEVVARGELRVQRLLRVCALVADRRSAHERGRARLTVRQRSHHSP